MQCPKCHTENPDTRKFCRECGGKLVVTCPGCGCENTPGDKFCGECGYALASSAPGKAQDLSFDEKISNIQKYLPEGLTQKILSQRDRIEGEKKAVTIMFCDMAGYTSLAEQMGAEEAYALMDQVYEILTHKVNDYEGTVNELTGDGIMAMFGAPIALENAPQRAIRSALAIHREMIRFSERIKSEYGLSPLRMRIGIHTGPVVVGTVGNDLRVDFKAIGDTVNLASRMESLAEPGTTYVTQAVFKLTEGLFRFENMGEKAIKGKSGPIHVYRVIAPGSSRTRFDVNAEKGLTPLMARERELEILMDLYRRARGGRGQAVSIVSVAGMGKSRLLYEFRKALAHEEVTFLEGRCLSYSKGLPYHPLIDILRSNFRIQETDRAPGIREKVESGLKAMGIDVSAAAPYLLELLSGVDSSMDMPVASPEAKRERIIGTLLRIVIKGAQTSHLVLAIEDLQWIDNSSKDVIGEILENIPAEKVFLILTYRPDFSSPWGTRSHHNQMLLSRLSDRECLAMAGHLLRAHTIENDLGELLVEKTEGVPFFVEEFIRSFVDLGVIENAAGRGRFAKSSKDVGVPSTIQDVIMARVDGLPETAKTILRIGSAIEREFGYQLIKKIAGISETALSGALASLKAAELILQRGIVPESTYIFRHALTMEVVYASILTRQKETLHRSIGEAMEALYEGNAEEHSASLARHFIGGGLHEKAAKYLQTAAKRARRAGSYEAAIEYSIRLVHEVEQLPHSEEGAKWRIDARTTLANHYMALSRHVEAKDAVDPIVNLALELDYRRGLPAIFAALGSYWVVTKYHDKGIAYLQQAIDAAKDIGDGVSYWNGNFFLGIDLALNCQFEKALECLETALQLSEKSRSLEGTVFVKSVMCELVLNFQGKVPDACRLSREAVDAAEICGDFHTRGMAYTARGTACFFKGELEQAEHWLFEAIDFCRNSGHGFWQASAEFFLAISYHCSQKYADARKFFSQTISTEQVLKGFSFWEIYARFCLKRTIVESGGDIDPPFPPEGYQQRNYPKFVAGQLEATVAEILLKIDPTRISEAEALLATAIAEDEKNGTRWCLAKDYEALSGLCRRKGDPEEAVASLNKAIEIMEACGAEGWVKKYREMLAGLQV
ncbi:MAG: AAA family ATPase [Desulfobacteraceae bacterium]|nr:AAA family ATPase [Desulfobacteraceae bacterium]